MRVTRGALAPSTLRHSILRSSSDPRLNLKSNELIHPALRPILEMVARELQPDMLGCYPFLKETSAWLAAYFGCAAEEIVLSAGSDAAIRLLCSHYTSQARERPLLIIQDPNYEAWEQTAATLPGLEVLRVRVPRPDPERQGRRLLAAARAARGALISVTVPNGLTGGSLPEAVLDELAAVARERDHLLVIDSAYQAFNGRFNQAFSRRGGPVLVVQTLSKSHGLAGTRIAVLSGDPERLAALPALRLEGSVSGPALLAAQVVTKRHDEFCAIWADIRRVRARTAAELVAWGLAPLPSGGNFLTVRVGSRAVAGATTELLSQRGVRVRDLSPLPGLDGCIRFTIGNASLADRFLDALRAAVADAKRQEVG
jgi:histidinol-phosphate/aromatic aminotransferase/cobyric acid decarboxylase-like protein